MMIFARIVAIFLAVPAERRSLEDFAKPFTAARARLSAAKTRLAGAH